MKKYKAIRVKEITRGIKKRGKRDGQKDIMME
jgi:hypothetical protein